MNPICRNAAVGTPAKQPIAVAVDQPPETSDDPVDEEAWVLSMAAYVRRFVHVLASFVAACAHLQLVEQVGRERF